MNRFKKAVPLRARKWAKLAIYSTSTSLGIPLRTAINDLDRKIAPFLPSQGIFIEAGANDGISQSNTYHLEKFQGWKGLLVEPIPWLAKFARRARDAQVFTCALGSFDEDGKLIEIMEADLMSSAVRGFGRRKIRATIRPLSHLIEESKLGPMIDLLSIDVEGFEKSVLQGIDFDQHTIRNILVETKNPGLVANILPNHKLAAALTHHDFIFTLK